MAGFLTTGQLAQIDSAYDTLHTTFAKTITVYKNSAKTVIASADYNPIYRRTNAGQTSITYEEVSETFEARVYYANMDEEYDSYQNGVLTKVVIPAGSVVITVQSAGYEYLREARRVEFDGNRFSIKSDGAPRGLGANKFYDFILTPTDE